MLFTTNRNYKNRNGIVYWFEELERPLHYRINGDLKYWRYGSKQGQIGIDMNDLGFADPGGGPFMGVGDEIDGNEIKRVYIDGDTVCFEVAGEYDVVIDVLTKHRDKLQEMTDRNLRSDFIGMNIMDDIRLKQIAQINQCIKMWENRNDK